LFEQPSQLFYHHIVIIIVSFLHSQLLGYQSPQHYQCTNMLGMWNFHWAYTNYASLSQNLLLISSNTTLSHVGGVLS